MKSKSRLDCGNKGVPEAFEFVAKAETIEALRQGQAVLLTSAFGLTVRQAAQAMGVSPGWVSRLRHQFLNHQFVTSPDRPRRGGRRRANMSLEEEREFLSRSALSGVSTAHDVKVALDKRLGRPVPMTSVYRLLRRHGGLVSVLAWLPEIDEILSNR